MLLAAGTVALFGHVSIANPLGDQFMDPRLGLMLLLISSTAAVLGLQSRVAEQLALSGPCRWRASWLLVLCGLHGVSTWQIAVDGRPPFGVLHIVAITFFFPVGLALFRVWLGLAAVFVLFVAVVVSPTNGAPTAWPLFGAVLPDSRGLLPLSIAIIVTAIYATNLAGHRRY